MESKQSEHMDFPELNEKERKALAFRLKKVILSSNNASHQPYLSFLNSPASPDVSVVRWLERILQAANANMVADINISENRCASLFSDLNTPLP